MKLIAIVMFFCFPLGADEEIKEIPSSKYQLTEVFQTDEVIWSFDFINKNEIVLTTRPGELFYYNRASKKKEKLQGPKVAAEGQGGLLDVHHQKVGDKEYLYMTFSERVGKTLVTSLARGEWKDKKLTNMETLFQSKVYSDSTRHFGSRLLFHNDVIFMTIGDRGERDYAQKLSHHNGSILRLTLEGKPAKDNPFAKRKNALDEIWSYGHRNPQGIAKDPTTKKIYSVEMGPRGGDELNLIEGGKNYGWPVITYGYEYYGPKIGKTHKKGMEQPVVYWVPSISPSGMAFYKGDKIPHWKNNLFLGCLSGEQIRRLVLKDGKVIEQEKLFADLDERFRHIRSGPDGYLYYSTDSGKIVRVGPK